MKAQYIFESMITDVEVINEKVIDEKRGLKEIEIKSKKTWLFSVQCLLRFLANCFAAIC